MNTKMTIMYRDADNYKMSYNIVIEGTVTPEDMENIRKHLLDLTFFDPEKIYLQHAIDNDLEERTDSDHQWHYFGRVEPTTEPPTKNSLGNTFNVETLTNYLKEEVWEE